MVVTTFNKELYERDLKQDAYEDGRHDKLKEMVLKKLQKGQSAAEIAEMLEESLEVIERIMNELR